MSVIAVCVEYHCKVGIEACLSGDSLKRTFAPFFGSEFAKICMNCCCNSYFNEIRFSNFFDFANSAIWSDAIKQKWRSRWVTNSIQIGRWLLNHVEYLFRMLNGRILKHGSKLTKNFDNGMLRCVDSSCACQCYGRISVSLAIANQTYVARRSIHVHTCS